MNDSLQFELLKEKILHLTSQVDSLKNVNSIQQLKYEVAQKQDVITHVNEFYDSAWLKLILVISVLGVIVPIVVQLFQRKNLKELTEFISTQMNDSVEIRIRELKSFNKTEIESALVKYNKNLEEIESKNQRLLIELDANTFYLQGRALATEGNVLGAIASFLKSAHNLVELDRADRNRAVFVNLRVAFSELKKRTQLAEIDKKLESSSMGCNLNELLDHFKNHSRNEDYIDELNKIIDIVSKIPN